MEYVQALNEPQSELKGVDGWLKFFVVARIYLYPIFTGVGLIASWALVGELVDMYPGLVVSALIETAVSIYFVGFSILVGTGLRDIKPEAVENAKKFLKYSLIWATVSPFVGMMSGLPGESIAAEGLKGFITTLVGFAIWYSYFNTSKRVQATYD